MTSHIIVQTTKVKKHDADETQDIIVVCPTGRQKDSVVAMEMSSNSFYKDEVKSTQHTQGCIGQSLETDQYN